MNSSQLDGTTISVERSPITNLPDIEVKGLQKHYGSLSIKLLKYDILLVFSAY